MHNLIEQCLHAQQAHLESPMMCYAILSGGYEKHLQTILGHELYIRTDKVILAERQRCDFRGVYNGQMTAIEMGVNALPNALDGVINHIVDNVNTVFQYGRARRVYAVGVVDSMVHCQHLHHLKLVKYPERYPLPIKDSDTQAEIKRISDSSNYFNHASLNQVRRIDFVTGEFEGYQMRTSFFVCGPFDRPLEHWW